MTEKPDLPILENVSASLNYATEYSSAKRKNLNLLIANTLTVALTLFLALHFFTEKNTMPGDRIFAFSLYPFALVMSRLLGNKDYAFKSAFYWETSSEGILSRGHRRSKFIRWTDIEKTQLAKLGIGYDLITKHGSFVVPQPPDNWTMNQLGASIWQHLRRVGKSDSMEEPYTAKLLWNEPEIRTAEWGLPRPIKVYFGYLMLFLFGSTIYPVLGYGLTSRKYQHIAELIVLILTLALIPLLMYLYRLHINRINRVEVSEDYIVLSSTRGILSLTVADIHYVEWRNKQLWIGFSRKDSWAIPYSIYHTESKHVLLAIVSRLSAIEHPQLLATPRDIITPPLPPLRRDWND